MLFLIVQIVHGDDWTHAPGGAADDGGRVCRGFQEKLNPGSSDWPVYG